MVNQLSIKKFNNHSFLLVIFVVVPLKKIPLFSKKLIIFIISFISLFVRVIPEPVFDEIPFLTFLPIILSLAFTRISLFNFLVPVFFNSFLTEFIIGFANYVISGSIGGPNRNLPNCTILEN